MPRVPAGSMAATRIEMEFHRDLRLLEVEVDLGEAFGNVGAVIRRCREESRRRALEGNDPLRAAGID